MGTKVFKLKELKDVQGRLHQKPSRDDGGNLIRVPVLDTAGKQVMQIPRNARGEAIPNAEPEPVYTIKTEPTGVDALPEILKGFYLNIPQDRLTRQDTIYGTRMFQEIEARKDGILEISDDIHDWIKKKLADENVGIKIFGVDLYVIEQALDDFERKIEKGGEKKDDTKS